MPPQKAYNLWMDSMIESLSPDLFWDVDPATIHAEKNARWLIERVLQRGKWEDWLVIKNYYSKKTLWSLAPRLRMDDKAHNFLRLYCED